MTEVSSYHGVLAALPVAAYTCDASGLIVDFNDAAVTLLATRPRLMDPDGRWFDSLSLLSVEDGTPIRRDECVVALAARTGEPQRDEAIVVRPDGTQITVLVQASPLRDDAGVLIGVVTVITDLTLIKQAEIAQAHLGAIVTSSDDAIVSKTLDGVIVTWNDGAQRLFGYTSAEVVGRPVTVIIPTERHGEERDILAKLVRGERVDHYETVRVTKHGELLDISLTSSPIRDSRGRIVGASKIARDITARKRNEEHLRLLHDELRQADRAKNDFLATLAHELRNPLAPIRSLLYLLERTDKPVQDLPRALTMMNRQITQMTRLIDDLMDVARISKNKFELQREMVDLATVIHTALETSRPLFAANEQELAVTIPENPVTLDADSVRLTQAISNVLNNASKYGNRGGRVALDVALANGDAVVTVTDNGVGIPPGMEERVFELFVQVPQEDSRQLTGLGVGLHLARRLVQMHGGSLTATSAGLGKGSQFQFTIPLTPTAPAIPARTGSTLPGPESVGKRVMVVDDNRDAADSLCMFLRILGHDALPLYDGFSVLEQGAAYRPDIILLDIGLPGIDGYETARRIRAEEWGSNIRLCALTGWGQDEARRKSKEAGFDAHFVKPVDAVTLVSALDALEENRAPAR